MWQDNQPVRNTFISSVTPNKIQNMISADHVGKHEKLVYNFLSSSYDIKTSMDEFTPKLEFSINVNSKKFLRPDMIIIGTNICIDIDCQRHFDSNAFFNKSKENIYTEESIDINTEQHFDPDTSLDQSNKDIRIKKLTHEFLKAKAFYENGFSLIKISHNIIDQQEELWQTELSKTIEYLQKIEEPKIVLMDLNTGIYDEFEEELISTNIPYGIIIRV